MVVRQIDLSKIAQNLLPDFDNLRNLGSAQKRWAKLFVAALVITSLTIGTITLTEDDGTLAINASVNITGDLDVQKLNATSGFIGADEIATIADLTGGNVTVTEIIRIQNKQGVAVGPLTLMHFSGYNVGQDAPEAQFALSTSKETPAECMTSETIANNAFGSCVISGLIKSVDTSQFTEDILLHLNDTDGTMTEIEPVAVQCVQEVGEVLRSHPSQGVMYANVPPGCQEVPSFINVTGNQTHLDNVRSSFGDDQDAHIVFNGSMLVIEVN